MFDRPMAPLASIIGASAVAALGGLLFGYDTAVVSGTTNFIQSKFSLSDLGLGWIVSSALLGCMLGAWAAGKFGDRIGRKRGLLICSILFFASAIWSGLVKNSTELAFARILGGIGIGAASMLTPVYISEIAPLRIRGGLTTMNQIAVLLGMVFVNLVNSGIAERGSSTWCTEFAWRWMFGSAAIPAGVFFVLLFFIPESPRWLVLRGRLDEARVILDRFSDGSRDDEGITKIQQTFTEQKPIRFSDCFRFPICRVFVVGAVLAVLQQLTGINIVMYYAPTIFTSAGINVSSAIGDSVIICLVMLFFTVLAMFLSDRLGRRPLLLLSATGMSLSLFSLGIAYSSNSTGGNGDTLLVWVLVYVASFSLGMGPLVWTVLGEIFPNQIRSHAVSMCVMLLWAANFLVSEFFPAFLRHLGFWVFIVYGIICAFTVWFVATFIPETKGKSLEDIEQDWTLFKL